MKSNDKTCVKILFRLKKDKDGYPPDDWESLWAYETEGGFYCIDNIPFFVRGISCGDIVSVNKRRNEYLFNAIKNFSLNSVIRVIVFEPDKIDELKKDMERFGCEYEGSHIKGLISFDVPAKAGFDEIIKYLQSGEDNEFWSYEEASIRHEN